MNLVDDGSGVRMAYVAPVFVSIFYGAPTSERLDFLFKQERIWVDPVPKFCALSVVDPRVGKDMSPEARAKAKEITEYFREKMVATVTVVPGTGFFPALVRSVVAGILLVSTRKTKWHVASELQEGVDFIAGVAAEHALPFDKAQIRAAVDHVLAGDNKQKAG